VRKRIFFIILLILLGLVLLGVGSWFLFYKNRQPSSIFERIALGSTSEKLARAAILDSDNDGLRDWEEALWKTDPNQTDTDKDGFSDYEETKSGYDPIDPLSNPKTGQKNLNNSPLPDSSKQETQESINITEQFAKTISSGLADQASLNQTDISDPLSMLDQNSAQSLLQFINNFHAELPEGEIKTHNDNSFAAVQKYADELEKAIPSDPYPGSNEDDIFTEAIETSNFKKIDDYISYYKTSISNMKKIAVPSDFYGIHKKQIESLMATKKVYESIKEINGDPIKTVLALQENQKVREETNYLLADFAKLAQEHVE